MTCFNFQPSKAKVSKIFSDLKSALKIGDKMQITKILDSLNLEKMMSDENGTESARKILFDKNDDEFVRKTFSFDSNDGDDYDDPTLVSRSSDDKTSQRKVVVLSKKDDNNETESEDNEDDYSKVRIFKKKNYDWDDGKTFKNVLLV